MELDTKHKNEIVKGKRDGIEYTISEKVFHPRRASEHSVEDSVITIVPGYGVQAMDMYHFASDICSLSGHEVRVLNLPPQEDTTMSKPNSQLTYDDMNNIVEIALLEAQDNAGFERDSSAVGYSLGSLYTLKALIGGFCDRVAVFEMPLNKQWWYPIVKRYVTVQGMLGNDVYLEPIIRYMIGPETSKRFFVDMTTPPYDGFYEIEKRPGAYPTGFLSEMLDYDPQMLIKNIDREFLYMHGSRKTPITPGYDKIGKLLGDNENIVQREIKGGNHGTPICESGRPYEELVDTTVLWLQDMLF